MKPRTRRPWMLIAGIAIGVFTTFTFMKGGAGPAKDQVNAGPILLAKIQRLGQLRTARFTYENVFDYRTSRQAAEWASYIPGADNLVRNATSNTALVSATGNVDAGVDLSRAKFEDGVVDGRKVRVLVVPTPQIFGAETDAQVHNARRGLFWDDNNIALKARRDADSRFRMAALQQGILKQAEDNAGNTLQAFLAEAGAPNLRIQFVR